ncbi:MAG: hypothetical protein HC855_11370 [Rhizobiales bacterium]|nr:hypothetical protein [Hyphomicrobiales bacterium]
MNEVEKSRGGAWSSSAKLNFGLLTASEGIGAVIAGGALAAGAEGLPSPLRAASARSRAALTRCSASFSAATRCALRRSAMSVPDALGAAAA